MRAVLHRERARADRTNREFSVVLLHLADQSWRSRCRLSRIVLGRTRVMDEIGVHDDQRICALLPETASFGAWRFAQNVCDIALAQGMKVSATVHTYPSRWFGERYNKPEGHDRHNGDDGGGDDHKGESQPMRHSEPAPASEQRRAADPQSADHDRAALMRIAGAGIELGLAEAGIKAPSLASLFVHPLPWWKRAIDLVGAGVGVLLTAPIMLLAAMIVRISSPGPALFKQKRAGLGGRPFTIYKFRTMCVDAEARQADLRKQSEQDGPAFKLTRDPRVTRIGKILRTTSLDELPQLFNVLKGNMTLVGPRPLPLKEADGCLLWQRQRLDVTPGLTCIWQVKGRSTVAFDEWIRMDMQYIKGRSLWSDLKILFQTLPAVILRKGAH